MDRITELRDQLSAIGMKMEDRELVFVPLNGLYHLGGFLFRASMLERQCRPSPGSRMTWCGKNSGRNPVQPSKRKLKIALIGRTKKGSKKSYKEKDGSRIGKKDLSKVMCF